MKYCVQYSNKSYITEKVDEIIIKYDKNKILDLFDRYIPEHQDKQRVIVDIWDDSDELKILETIIQIHKERPQLKFDLRVNNYDEKFIEKLKSIDIPYFYRDLARNWDIFLGLLKLGVSDIYIVEEMGFELDKISKIAKSQNTKIRIYPNIAQSAFKSTEDIYKFFVRPEDIDVYEKYVDVYEILTNDKSKEKVFFDVYKNDKKWFGNLNELLLDFNIDLDSKYIIPRFAEKRVRCGRQCLKGGKCQLCSRVIDLSKNLEKANLIVTIDRKEEEEEKYNGKRTEE